MRNCFVPGCDAFCRKSNMSQRKMFLAPSSAGMLDKWAAVLHHKRTFKSHDRVCQRHFQPEDIIEYWESRINGEIHLTPRDKPKLRENVIPSKNLPARSEVGHKAEERLLERRKEKTKILSQKIIGAGKRKAEDSVDEEEQLKPDPPVVEQKKPKIIVTHFEELPRCTLDVNEAVMLFEVDTVTNQHEAIFESLYDEAFDVTLPSLLWGIHRDPENKFLVFTEFNPAIMSTSRVLHISNTLRCTTSINGKFDTTRTLDVNLSVTDQVSSILDELDKTPLV